MRNFHLRKLLMVALLTAAGALAACTDSTTSTSSNDQLENWGPHGGPQGMGGAGPAAHPGD
ncbi:hypothetical protein [Geminicoccus harenae]|uniref:hypothetical protein n=1 Tax=Geminicoccus harenae TaxID=2498453 RepID=UPI00168AA424|nr:hypothetical protein [Geminicoccus harenae]